MAIIKMKKLKLFALRSERDALLHDLMLLGCIEVTEPEYPPTAPELSALISRDAGELDALRASHTGLKNALDILGQYAPVKTKIFIDRPTISEEQLFCSDTGRTLELAENVERLDRRIRRLNREAVSAAGVIESLRPWESMSVPLGSDGTNTSTVIIGTVPASTDLEHLKQVLQTTVPESECFKVSTDKEQHYIEIICLRERQQTVYEVLRRFSFSPPSIRGIQGFAGENIRASAARLTALQEEKDEIIAQIQEAGDKRDALRLCYDLIGTRIAKAEAAERLLNTEATVLLTGWVTAPSERVIHDTLSKYICAWELADPVREEYDKVPVSLKNNGLTSPLMMVTEMYSLPAYGGIDPNPLMMPFFVLFYGLMMADMGYGLVMMTAALLIKRKKPQGGMKNFFNLLLLCGISTFIIGVMTGGFFGDAPAQIAGLFGRTFTMPYKPLFDPLTNTMQVLYGALILGFIQIIFGMGISFVKQVKDGHLLDALFDIGSWWLLFIGLGVGALGITWYVAIVGAAAIVLTNGRAKPSIIGKLVSGIGALYNITGYFGDVLSYSRLMALMLAGGVIAQVFNTLGALTGNIVTFTLVFLAGHALNFGLNLLGCFVHDLRLQCLEFFGKFYEDGGKPFKPLRVKTKYNNIVYK